MTEAKVTQVVGREIIRGQRGFLLAAKDLCICSLLVIAGSAAWPAPRKLRRNEVESVA